jgi:hypothetical protein
MKLQPRSSLDISRLTLIVSGKLRLLLRTVDRRVRELNPTHNGRGPLDERLYIPKRVHKPIAE